MKIQELINELEKIKAAHPDAEVIFGFMTYLGGNSHQTEQSALVDCRWEGRYAQIRLCNPLDLAKLKENIEIQMEQKR